MNGSRRARPEHQPYLTVLQECAIYVLIIANEYGQPDGDLSATHHEYREAQRRQLPTIVFLKGAKDDARSPEMRALIDETKKDGYKYVRFHDREDLKPLMLEALRRALAEEFKIKATSGEISEGRHLIEAASSFETAVLSDVPVEALDSGLVAEFNQRTAGHTPERAGRTGGEALSDRGLAVPGKERELHYATAAAWLLFGPRPAGRFPQAEILVDAYDEIRISGRPKGQESVNVPLPRALDQVLRFIDTHTFHPRRVVGLNNLRLDEYPVAALREALVNAVAHRSYEDRSRKIFIHIFSDRIEIASPGYHPSP